MDLNDVWQGNKRFILGVGSGLVLFLVAEGVIGSLWDVGARRRTVDSLAAKLRRESAPRQGDLTSLEAENVALEERLAALRREMGFVTEERYRLPEREATPDLYFNATRSAARDELVDVAARRNIRVDESLGLPELTPSGREAIQRGLRGLNVVEHVVGSAIVAGVRSIPEIAIVEQKGRRRDQREGFIDAQQVKFRIEGTTSSIAELLQTLIRDRSPFLAVEEAELTLDTRSVFGMTSLKLTVAGLAIAAEAPEPGA